MLSSKLRGPLERCDRDNRLVLTHYRLKRFKNYLDISRIYLDRPYKLAVSSCLSCILSVLLTIREHYA